MTLPIDEARRLGIPLILIQSAIADGILDDLIGAARSADDPEPLVGAQSIQEQVAPLHDTCSPACRSTIATEFSCT